MNKPKLKAQGFPGTVLTKEWTRWHTGKQYIGFFGKIFIYQDKELVGFLTRGNQANWMIRVQGRTTSINLLGCQIRELLNMKIDLFLNLILSLLLNS